jgi:hypothetical protein
VEGPIQVGVPLAFTAVKKGDERRAQYHDLRTIDELMQEMSTDSHMEFDVADWIVNGTKTVIEMEAAQPSDEEKSELKAAGFAWWPETTGSTTGHWWCKQPEDPTGKAWFCWGGKIYRELVEMTKEKKEEQKKKKEEDEENEKNKATGATGTTGTEPTTGGAASSSSTGTQPPAQSGGQTVST